MAYKAVRKKIYTEEFQLTEEDGTVVHVIDVELDADSMVKKLSEKHMALARALECAQRMKDEESEDEMVDRLNMLGGAVVDLLEAVFGKNDAKTIVDFYNSRYVEMCQEVIPFITDVVIPQVRKIAQDNKKNVLSQYGKQKKMSFFGRY